MGHASAELIDLVVNRLKLLACIWLFKVSYGGIVPHFKGGFLSLIVFLKTEKSS